MKSGTTLLHKLLSHHPDIYMSAQKEPCFFVDQLQLRALQPWLWSQGYWRSQDVYLELFKPGADKAYVGESSVYYTHLPLAAGVPERIKRFSPDARLIYIVRDPVERTISHYWHRVMYNNECRSIEHAIKFDSQYRDVSYYAMQLAPYYGVFGRHQVKILTLEELLEDCDQTLKSIFRWLGIEDRISLPQLTYYNDTPAIIRQRIELVDDFLNRLKNYTILRRSLSIVPESIKNAGLQMFTRKINRMDVDIEPVVDYLRPLQREQTKELCLLTGRAFREWRTINS